MSREQGEGERWVLIQLMTADRRGGDLSWVTSAGAAAGDHSLLQAMQHSLSRSLPFSHSLLRTHMHNEM